MSPCENSSYIVTLISSNGSEAHNITNKVSDMFKNTTELTGAISVSVTAVNKGNSGNASVATPNNGKYAL